MSKIVWQKSETDNVWNSADGQFRIIILHFGTEREYEAYMLMSYRLSAIRETMDQAQAAAEDLRSADAQAIYTDPTHPDYDPEFRQLCPELNNSKSKKEIAEAVATLLGNRLCIPVRLAIWKKDDDDDMWYGAARFASSLLDRVDELQTIGSFTNFVVRGYNKDGYIEDGYIDRLFHFRRLDNEATICHRMDFID